MRNEGPYILEWLAHHRALGIDSALVFSNACDDGSDHLLDLLGAAGVVHHVRHAPRGKSIQWAALRAARDHPAYTSADWALALDCDEFVNIRNGRANLPALLDANAGTDAIALPWRLFGSDGRMRFEDRPVTKRFRRAAPEGMLFPAASRFFKSLYNARAGAFARPGVHRPKTRASSTPRWRDGAGRALGAEFAGDDARILLPPHHADGSVVQINHYSLKSAEEFLAKRRRGLPNRASKPLDATYWAERNFNLVEEPSIDRHAAAMSQEHARLVALPGVAEAHANCVAAHRRHISEALRHPEDARLFTRLSLLPSSRPPDNEVAIEMLEIMRSARL
ncbi:MAG: glycosyltransferase family 2 protein [Pseudomonadota bacterium]